MIFGLNFEGKRIETYLKDERLPRNVSLLMKRISNAFSKAMNIFSTTWKYLFINFELITCREINKQTLLQTLVLSSFQSPPQLWINWVQFAHIARFKRFHCCTVCISNFKNVKFKMKIVNNRFDGTCSVWPCELRYWHLVTSELIKLLLLAKEITFLRRTDFICARKQNNVVRES